MAVFDGSSFLLRALERGVIALAPHKARGVGENWQGLKKIFLAARALFGRRDSQCYNPRRC